MSVQQLAGIALYIGRTSPLYAERMVERILRRVDTLAEFPEIGLRASEADARLIALIKEHGKWVDPEPAPA